MESDFSDSQQTDESMSYKVLEAAATAKVNFVKSLEQWLLALIQANYSKRDDQIVRKAMDSCKSSVVANITYHEELAKHFIDEEPVIARQHRLLAHMYRDLSETYAQS